MKMTLWMFCVLVFLIFIPPILMIMMVLVLTDIPLGQAVIYWLPVATIGTIAMTLWYHRQGQRLAED